MNVRTRFFSLEIHSLQKRYPIEILQPKREGKRTKTLVFVDEGIVDGNPNLLEQISSYFRSREERINLVCPPKFIKGGEPAKNDWG